MTTHKMAWWVNFLAYLAIPVTCALFAFPAAFGIWGLPESITGVFALWSVIYAQAWFWSCSLIATGIILKNFRNTNLYIWFEYPGLILTAFMAFVYAGALIVSFGIDATAYLAISGFMGIGLRFLFRWLEVHLLLMDNLKDDKHDQE